MRVHWVRVIVILQFCIFEQVAAPAADFSGVNLTGAHLTNADLSGSNLSGADLTGADFSGANLTDTNVIQSQLDSACGSGTKLPAGLRIQPCPSGTDADANGRRTNVDQALPEVRVQTQDSQQPPDHEKVSTNSQIDVSTRVRRQ
jgi:uncharacterized protein YjbI with pentapeptide repeats